MSRRHDAPGHRRRPPGRARAASRLARLRAWLHELYFGRDRRSERFHLTLLALDLLVIALFVAATLVEPRPWLALVEFAVGLVLLVEFAARALAERRPRRYLLSWTALADLLVVATLLVPAFLGQLAFLRVLRAVRLLHSRLLLRRVERLFPHLRHRRTSIRAAIDLVVFVFVTSALVFVQQRGVNPEIASMTDALYFTVTALTTTGFGDVVLVGTAGRLLAVAIMIVGISLFIRLAQSLVRPPKVEYPCPSCGLRLHDPDAVHCKHCGTRLAIPTEGM